MFGSFAVSKNAYSSEDYAMISSFCKNSPSSSNNTTPREKIRHQVETNSRVCPLSALSSIVIHSITTELQHDEYNFPYTLYVLLLEDPRTGRKWSIKRRYSTIEKFRTNVLYALETPHCHCCAELMDRFRAIPFPSRCLWGSLSNDVISKRMVRFDLFAREILKLTGLPYFKICSKVKYSIGAMIHTFFTYDASMYKCIEYPIPCLLEILTTTGHLMNTIREEIN